MKLLAFLGRHTFALGMTLFFVVFPVLMFMTPVMVLVMLIWMIVALKELKRFK